MEGAQSVRPAQVGGEEAHQGLWASTCAREEAAMPWAEVGAVQMGTAVEKIAVAAVVVVVAAFVAAAVVAIAAVAVASEAAFVASAGFAGAWRARGDR